MANRKLIVWWGIAYEAKEVAEIVDEQRGACCPKCNEGGLVGIAPNLIQYGMFEDIYFEFTECDHCGHHVMVRSKIVLEGGIPFETMLDEYIKSHPDYIPF